MDFQGKWFCGAVVEMVEEVPSFQTLPMTRTKRVKVRFDKFGPKHDETYDITSHKLAPRNTHTAKSDTIAPIVIRIRSAAQSDSIAPAAMTVPSGTKNDKSVSV
jgi:hypothetical protein